MGAIFKKEFKSYFFNFIGWIFVAATMFFLGLYFTIYNAQQGMPYVSYPLSACVFMYLITVPILTMRSIAEERKSKTDQLILTVPVTLGKIVIGKYLSLVAILAIPVGIFCFAPVLMSFYGAVPMGMAYLSILGFFLFGATGIAIGLFISSLTENQVIAAVLSFAALFLCYVMPSLSKTLAPNGGLPAKILMCFNLTTPFEKLLAGTVNLTSLVYFISVIVLMLFLTTQVIQKRRYTVSKNTISIGAYSTVSVIIAIAVTVVLNMVVGSLPATYTTLDITTEKLYSITEPTKEYLAGVDEDITIYVLVAEDSADAKLQKMLDYYCAENSHISVKYIDPTINPKFAYKYSDTALATNSLIVVSSKRSTVVDYNDIYETEWKLNEETYQNEKVTTGYDGEGRVSNAIDLVLRDDFPIIYMTTGHGEQNLDDVFMADLKKSNYDIRTLDFIHNDLVPSDASCVIIYGPSSDFSFEDVARVESYIDKGGKVIFVAGLSAKPMPNIDKLMTYMGVKITSGFIIEPDKDYYYLKPFFVLPEVVSSKYSNVVYKKNIIIPYTHGLKLLEDRASNIDYFAFLRSSSKSYAKNEVPDESNISYVEGDEMGVFAVGAEIKKYISETEAGIMIFFGSTTMFTQTANEYVSGNNELLFSNTVANFCDVGSNLVIPVKPFSASYLSMSTTTIITLGVLSVIVVPIACLIIGFAIWFRRRVR